jgi:alpha-tubulin suppressor-like RCC1 family protein
MNKLIWLALYFLTASIASATNLTDPTLTISGVATSQQTISVTVTGTQGTLYYTTDGTNPTTSSAVVTTGSMLLIAQNALLKVQAIQTSTTTSDVVTAQYGIAAQVSAGTNHTLFLKNGGTVWASGDNSAGELGTGTLLTSSQPAQVMINSTTPLTGIVAVAAGTQQSFAVDNQGNVWAWGLNANGQLGTGGIANVVNPVQVPGLSGAVSVASSGGHTLALLSNGSVWAWGANGSGQVGNGATSSWVTQPTQVLAPNSQTGPDIQNIVAVATGSNHSLALENTGKVYAWGDNSYGQLGDGDTALAMQTKPVYVKTSGVPFTSVVQVTANGTNSFALQGNGSAYSWGDNTIGELGNGMINPATPVTPANLSPAQVGSLTTLTSVANQSALTSTGTVWTWGDDTNGRLGVGVANGYAASPLMVSLTSGSGPTLAVTAGNAQTVTDGTLSTPFIVTASSYGSPLSNTWVNFVVPQSEGLLTVNSNGTQLSPIVGELTNSQGVATFYLNGAANASGPAQIIATSGSSQTTLSAIEQAAAQIASSGEPTMPEWMLIIMAGALIYFATRQKIRPIG